MHRFDRARHASVVEGRDVEQAADDDLIDRLVPGVGDVLRDPASLLECVEDAGNELLISHDRAGEAAGRHEDEEAVEQFGGIDIVIANAGIGVYGTVLNVDPAAFETGIDVNVMGVFNTVRAALPSVIDRRGYVLVVSSLAAYAPIAGSACYSLAKAGVEHFANALRLEVAHHGVDVGTAHMSWIDTPLVRDGTAEFSSMRAAIEEMPGPLSKITSVQACGAAFVKGIERRQLHINCPGWVGLFRWLKPILSTRVGLPLLLKGADQRLAQMDAETAGRHLNARIAELDGR